MKCPGQDMQYWKGDAIYEVPCPQCGKKVEFYKDDTNRRCGSCGHRFVNPRLDFGCAAYCQFAEQCVGTLPEEAVAVKSTLFKDKLAIAVKKFFKQDFKNISFTAKIVDYAETLANDTVNLNKGLLLCSAYLLPVVLYGNNGLHEAEILLENLHAESALKEDVLRILGKIHAHDDLERIEEKLVHDALAMVNFEHEIKENRGIQENTAFLTKEGEKLSVLLVESKE